MALLRSQLVVVVHQVRVPENLGAIARLMSNFGFGSLVLSDQQLMSDVKDAEPMARRGAELLQKMSFAPNLDEALKDCVYACGSTSRELIERRATIDPETAAQRLFENAQRGRVALVLGGEKRGLSDEDLSRCQDICVIPTEAEPQPSMNLAQAAAVLLYLCARTDRPDAPAKTLPEGARLQAVKVFETLLKDLLLRSEFLNPRAPDYVLEELLQSLHRGQLTQRELELWLGAVKAISRQIPQSKG